METTNKNTCPKCGKPYMGRVHSKSHQCIIYHHGMKAGLNRFTTISDNCVVYDNEKIKP